MKLVWRSMIWTLIVEIFITWMGYHNTHSAKVLLICVIIILIGMPIKFFDERKKYLKEQEKKKEQMKSRQDLIPVCFLYVIKG